MQTILQATEEFSFYTCTRRLCLVLLDGEHLEEVDKFKYLGSMVIANGKGTEDIRINLTRSAFSRLQSCRSPHKKGRVYQAEVHSILLCGCET